MDLISEAGAIRRQVARTSGHYPPELVARVRSFVAAGREAGESMRGLAEALGIPVGTVYRWQQVPTLRPVEVVAEQQEVVVYGPCGLRIEGLDLEGVAELLRKLA